MTHDLKPAVIAVRGGQVAEGISLLATNRCTHSNKPGDWGTRGPGENTKGQRIHATLHSNRPTVEI